MLEDRHYMRQQGFRTGRSATIWLLVSLLVAFIIQQAAQYWFHFPVDEYFALSTDAIRHGMVWQLVTFQFLHGGWLHLILNGWAIYVFGRELEETLGAKRYLALYFSSGIVGGLLQALAGVVIGKWYAYPVVGASAGVFGLIAAYASLYPERPLMLLLFFIIPVTMRAKFLLLFSAILALLGILFPGASNIAHTAHLGGMIGGMAFVKHAMNWHWPKRRSRPRAPRLVRVYSNPDMIVRPKEDSLGGEDFLSKEVDPILDKISAQGIQSLTERERQILESARKKMGRR